MMLLTKQHCPNSHSVLVDYNMLFVYCIFSLHSDPRNSCSVFLPRVAQIFIMDGLLGLSEVGYFCK